MDHDQTAEAIRMRTEGHSLKAIGARLGVSRQTIGRSLVAAGKAADAAAVAPVVAAVRDYRAECHRTLDLVIAANISRADNPGCGNLLLRAVETLARLEGLVAAPVKVDVASGTDIRIFDYRDGGPTAEMTAVRPGRAAIDIDAVLIPGPTLVNKPPEVIAARAAGQQAKPEPATPKPARAPAAQPPPEPRESGSDYFVSTPAERDRVYSSNGSGFGGRPSTTEW